MKNKKGVSLVVLAVTIIVTIILASIVTVEMSYNRDNYTKLSYAEELYMITSKMEDYYLFNNTYPIKNIDVVINLNTINSDFSNELSDENIISNEVTLKQIDLYKADITGNTRGNAEISDDIYAFSESTLRVYYIKGMKIGSKNYYSLNSELSDFIKINKVN